MSSSLCTTRAPRRSISTRPPAPPSPPRSPRRPSASKASPPSSTSRQAAACPWGDLLHPPAAQRGRGTIRSERSERRMVEGARGEEIYLKRGSKRRVRRPFHHLASQDGPPSPRFCAGKDKCGLFAHLRIDLLCFVDVALAAFLVALVLLGDAALVERQRVARIDLQRRVVIGDRGIVVALGGVRHAA